MILTIDIGNSRIKWAGWCDGEIVARGNAGHIGEKFTDDFFRQLFSALSTPEQGPSQVSVVCVAEQAVSDALDLWIKQNWVSSIDYLETQKHYKSIIHAYADPSQHGADRWAALIAAQMRFPQDALCIIGAGTAITFDFLEKEGQHLGGYILPSYRTMHKALTADTVNVISAAEAFEIDAGSGKRSLPTSTNEAVNAGLHRLLQSGIRDICATVICDDGVVDTGWQIIITGGGAEEILGYPDMPAMCHEPDLVMLGLYEVLQHKRMNRDL